VKFKEALKKGKETEKEILSLIQYKYPDAFIIDGYKKEYDIYIPKIKKSVEVKQDYKSEHTGNYVIEVFMFGKPSGLLSSTADFWVFSDGEKYTWTTRDIIKDKILMEGYRQVTFTGKGDNAPKQAYLVPKKAIEDTSLMIKYIGKLNEKCDICGKYGDFIYKDDKSTMKAMFPEVNWEEQLICEGCAKRESGKRDWNKIKRKQ
tara:strand:- start:423 stop:1034 length:612 start_codon:yes stop_codon:yes gene_type:complete